MEGVVAAGSLTTQAAASSDLMPISAVILKPMIYQIQTECHVSDVDKLNYRERNIQMKWQDIKAK